MHQPSLFDTLDLEPTPAPVPAQAESASEHDPAPQPARVQPIDWAKLWAEMPVEEIPRLLQQCDHPAGRRKIADMLIHNRPDLADRVEACFATLTRDPQAGHAGTQMLAHILVLFVVFGWSLTPSPTCCSQGVGGPYTSSRRWSSAPSCSAWAGSSTSWLDLFLGPGFGIPSDWLIGMPVKPRRSGRGYKGIVISKNRREGFRDSWAALQARDVVLKLAYRR